MTRAIADMPTPRRPTVIAMLIAAPEPFVTERSDSRARGEFRSWRRLLRGICARTPRWRYGAVYSRYADVADRQHVSISRGYRRAAAVVSAAMLVSSCGGDESAGTASTTRENEPVSNAAPLASDSAPPATDPAPAGVDGEVDVEALDAELADLIELPAEDQEARLAALDAEFERELWTLSGLEAALGGPEAADAAFAAHSEAIVSGSREIVAEPILMTGLRRRPATAPQAPNLGEGLFGGILLVMLGSDSIVSSTNDAKDGESGTGKWGEHTTISGSLEHVEMIADLPPFESHGVTTKLRVTIKVSPCPDATGRFEAKATIDVSATTTGGSTGQEGVLDMTVTGQVDDDAKLASADVDYHMQWADFVGGTSSLVDVSGAIGDTKVVGATMTHNGGTPSATLQQDASTLSTMYAYLAGRQVAEAAQKGWQSGRCVRLEPTAAPGPKGVKPGSTSTITAPPRSRVDGLPAGGTVTATLTAGGAGVEPSATKVAADATFTYTAPDAINKSGTVSLEARSKRGVAKASIDFDTVGTYTASGGTEVTFSGTVADLAAPFALVGVGQGFDVNFSFTPSSATAGALVYTGSGDGFTMEGSGTYTIAGADPDPLTLTYTASGCVSIGGCRTTTNAITLTRTP